MHFFTKTSFFQPASAIENAEKNPVIINRIALVIKRALAIIILMISVNAYALDKAIPQTPGPVTGPVNVCAYVGSNQVIDYSITAVEGAELYLWTVPPTVTIVSGQGTTSISVKFSTGFTSAANKQIKVRAISEDGNSPDRLLYLTSQQPSTPNNIVGPSNACVYIGTSTQAVYTTAKDPNATSYVWGTDPATTLVNHPNGAGVNDTIIRVIFKNGYKSKPITVQSANHCGFSAARTIVVSGAAPSTPGVITGPTNACAYMLPDGIDATYSINPVAGASSYTWIVPADCVVQHPNGLGASDITISVQYPPTFTGGSIAVIANSGCDESAPRTLNVTKLNPATPGVISAIQKVICPAREFLYSIPSMPLNATEVNWTVPADAIGFSGQGTTGITVLYAEPRVSGAVTVRSINNCASSTIRQTLVNLGRCQLERSSGNTAKGVGSENVTEEAEQTLTETINKEFEIKIAPNPSKSSFKLQVNSIRKEIIILHLLDLQGRELKKMTLIPGQSIVFGNELKAGTYVVEVTQGKLKRTEKLLKL